MRVYRYLVSLRFINAIGDRPTVQGFVIKEASGVEAQDAAVPEVKTFLLLATGMLAFACMPQRLRGLV